MAKNNLGAQGLIIPDAVLIIGTYDENGTPNAMNCAWGGQCGKRFIALNISNHKTTENLQLKKAFTIAFGDQAHLVESDYLGVVSGRKVPDKIEKAGLTVTKSEFVDAPVINEFPVSLECKVASMGLDEATGEIRIVGEILNVQADDSVMTDGVLDWGKVRPLVYDSSSNYYRVVGEVVGNAFKDGLQLAK